jgi:hypothetical protein
VVAVAAAAALTTGCSTFTNTDRVATVNGTDISRDEFDEVADEYFGKPELYGSPPVLDGHVDADSARGLLGAIVQTEILHATVADESAIAAARDGFFAAIPAEDPLFQMSEPIRNLIADIQPDVQTAALASLPAPSDAELEQRYAADPATAGVMCVRHILSETEADADAIAADLADGADFAELATERSTDPTAAANGGALTGQGGECLTVPEAIGGLDAVFVANAFGTGTAAPSAPFRTDFGWHIVMHRPWSEVGESVVALHADGQSGLLQYGAAIVGAEVHVSPEFGVWDSGSRTVVPLG